MTEADKPKPAATPIKQGACKHEWKKLVEKDGKPKIQQQENGASVNASCTNCEALAWMG